MLAALGAIFLLHAAHAEGPGTTRVALVIGNGAYATAPLVNPANDARAVGELLRSMGFQVIALRDASRAQMVSGIEAARRALSGKHGVALLYYAGHAVQLDWRNYLIPVDAKLVAQLLSL